MQTTTSNTRLNFQELKDIINNSKDWYWFEVEKYGKTTSRETLVKFLLAKGFEHPGLVLDDPKEVALTPGTVPYIQKQLGLALGLTEVSKSVVNSVLKGRLDSSKVGNGIVAITLQGLSGKEYWLYALSVVEKILNIEVPEIVDTQKETLEESKQPSELTQQQKSILAQAANTLGFQVSFLGEGIKSVDITADDIQGIYLHVDSGLYQLKTRYGSNFWNREVFKAAVRIWQ